MFLSKIFLDLVRLAAVQYQCNIMALRVILEVYKWECSCIQAGLNNDQTVDKIIDMPTTTHETWRDKNETIWLV